MSTNKGTLSITAPYEITEVRVLDHTLREVAAGTHALSVELEPGIYQVQARVPGDFTQQLIAVEAGSKVAVQDLKLTFDSATPLEAARSHHEFHIDPAETYSKQPHLRIGEDPKALLFLFARGSGQKQGDLPKFDIRDRNGTLIAGFPSVGSADLNWGWLALSLALPAGTYLIEQEVPGLGLRGQAIRVEENWETQLFAPWDATPDFSLATIYMRPKGSGFQAKEHWKYNRVEAALMGLARGKLVLPPDEINEFLYGKFDNPMLGLIGAYALLDQEPVDYAQLRHVSNNISLLLPHSPDARLISLLAELEGNWPPPTPVAGWPVFDEPPLFAIGMSRLLNLAMVVEEICPANGWVAEISLLLTTGSAWTRWELGVETPAAFTRLQGELTASSNRYFENIASAIHIPGLPEVLKRKALKAMMTGSAPLLIKILKGVGIKPSTLFEKSAQQLARELAPRVGLPISIIREILKQMLEGEELLAAVQRLAAKQKKATTAKGAAALSKKKRAATPTKSASKQAVRKAGTTKTGSVKAASVKSAKRGTKSKASTSKKPVAAKKGASKKGSAKKASKTTKATAVKGGRARKR